MSFYCNTFLTEGFCSVLKVFPNSETFSFLFFPFFLFMRNNISTLFRKRTYKKKNIFLNSVSSVFYAFGSV